MKEKEQEVKAKVERLKEQKNEQLRAAAQESARKQKSVRKYQE